MPLELVRRLDAALGGDQRREQTVVLFMWGRWEARSFFHLPRMVAEAATQRPADFLRAAEAFCAKLAGDFD